MEPIAILQVQTSPPQRDGTADAQDMLPLEERGALRAPGATRWAPAEH